MLLADWEIKHLVREYDMITPFVDEQQRYNRDTGEGIISYGLSSYGYDIRVDRVFKVFSDAYCTVIDPKNFDERSFVEVIALPHEPALIPPNSFALAQSVEAFNMPPDVTAICVGKSTLARCGIIVNITPLEAGWKGVLTIEISNTTPLPVKIYAFEGIAQLLFFKGKPCLVPYSARAGKYQGQKGITLPIV